MWLLDANVDIHLSAFLSERGILCDTAANRGWKALSNGQLVAAAIEGGFDCLLTRDRLFAESASRVLRVQPHFAIVLITLAQQLWPAYRACFLEAWNLSPIQPQPGKVVKWPVFDS